MRHVRLAELEGVAVSEHGLVWKPLRHTLGIESFGVNAYTAAKAGDEVVEDHDETGSGAGHHEELYLVVSGRATFTVGGEMLDAPAGTCVFFEDPSERRAAVAQEGGTTVLAIGAARGEAFRVSPWEFSFRALAAAAKGRLAEARTIMEEGLSRYPDNASLLYNFACYESRDDDVDAALEHLRRALEQDAKLREHAATDPDLERLRADSRYPG